MGRSIDQNNIKKIIDALREGPKSWTDLMKLGVPEKSLHRILTIYLTNWNLTKKDKNELWVWYDHIKSYDSEGDRKLAIEHTNKLFSHELRNGREFHDINPYKALDMIVFSNESSLYLKNILKHFKTGYKKEIYENIIKYKKLMEEYGLSRFTTYPIITISEFEVTHRDRLVEITDIVDLPIGYNPKNNDDDEDSDGKGIETAKYIEKVALEKILELRSFLVSRYMSLLFSIEMGNLLMGMCDYCPNSTVKS